jgi:hypothetical protein
MAAEIITVAPSLQCQHCNLFDNIYFPALMHGTVTVAVSLTHCCTVPYQHSSSLVDSTEAESKEKHGVWNPMPELTI